MRILVHNIFVALLVPIWQCHFLAIFSSSRFGYSCATEMLFIKIHIYIKFPVDTNGIWCHNVDKNMIYLNSKIFHETLSVNMLVKLQAGKGTPRDGPMGEFFDVARSMGHVPLLFAQGAWLFHTWCFLGQPNRTTPNSQK